MQSRTVSMNRIDMSPVTTPTTCKLLVTPERIQIYTYYFLPVVRKSFIVTMLHYLQNVFVLIFLRCIKIQNSTHIGWTLVLP